MKTIGLFEAKTRLSEICEEVSRSGQAVLLTRRGKPLVRIDPIPEDRPSIRERRANYLAKYGKKEPDDAEDFDIPARSTEIREFDPDASK